MASFKQYTASGGASENFSIASFTSDEIKVRVDGVLKTAATHYNITNYTTNGGTVTWIDDSGTGGTDHTPSSGTVRIYRDTNILNDAESDVEGKSTYYAGSSIKADDLNDNLKQALRSLEEQDDQKIQTYNVEDKAITSAKLDTNIDIAGTLDVTGATTLDSTLSVTGTTTAAAINASGAVGVDGNFDVNTNKFTVAASSGNTTVAGTLAAGATTVTGNIAVSGTVDGRDVAADGSKLDGVAINANNYTHPTHPGDDLSVDTGALTGAVVVSDVDINVTTDGSGHVTDANGVVSTRTLTLANLGYTGETDATADQTGAQIKTAYEAESDTNAYTDAEKSKVADAVLNADLDGKGEILVGDGSGDPSALAVGTNDYVLTADSTEATGVKWAAAPGAGGGGSNITVVDESTTLSTAATKFTFAGAGVTATEPSTDEITVTIPGGTDTNTTYTQAANDAGSGNVNLRLTAGGSGSGDDDILITAGANVTIGSISAAGFTISATDTNTQVGGDVGADFNDDVKARFGTGNDLSIYGNGTSGFINTPHSGGAINLGTSSSTGILVIDSNGVTVKSDLTIDNGSTTALSAGSLITIEPHAVSDTDGIRFKERNANGSAYIGLKGVLDKGSDASYTITLPSAAPASNGQVLSATTAGVASWATISGTITALNNQTANRLTTIGSTTTELDGEANLTFEDTTSTGLISGKQITGRGFECPATVSDDWTIAAGNNAFFPGPMTVAASKTVTVPADRTLTIV